ncbi:MAG: carboxypeptidase-like regulatory domain-containing protein, partial [Alistipes ihumii]
MSVFGTHARARSRTRYEPTFGTDRRCRNESRNRLCGHPDRRNTLGTATDAAGFYSLSRLPESRPITAVASAVGYDRQKQTVAIITGQQTRLDFKLRSTAIMEQIVVTADRQATKRTEAPTVVNVLSSKLFDQTSSGNIA